MSNRIETVQTIQTNAWKPEPELVRPRRRSIIREFALNTSTHALPGIARSQSKHNRIFWTISFLAFTGIMSYFVVESIINYFQYPTQTSVSIVAQAKEPFPAVTICNYCPARFDLMIGPFLNYTNTMNWTNTTNTSTFSLFQAQKLRDYLVYKINAGESLTSVFFGLNIMLMECTFNGYACNASDFIPFISSTYGLCYTFNARRKDTQNYTIRNTNDYGGKGRLFLRLYTHNHLYVPYITEDVTSGMIAMIHDSTELPLVEIAGLELIPGRKHRLTYKKRTNYFLPAPYTDCTDKVTREMQAMFDQYGGADYAYSQGVCYILCGQAYAYEKCKCVNPYEWSARNIVLSDNDTLITAPLCPMNDYCYLTAANQLANSSDDWDQYCSHCTQACFTADYMITPSASMAASDYSLYLAKIFVESTGVPLPSNWANNWLTHTQNNYIGLEVLRQSVLVENYSQDASLSPVDVLSNVGGHTGLWIGISFLSIMELVEMLYRLCRLEVHILVRKIKDRK